MQTNLAGTLKVFILHPFYEYVMILLRNIIYKCVFA